MIIDTAKPETYPSLQEIYSHPYLVWGHAQNGWKWSKDANCYVRKGCFGIVSEICLGERYAHMSYGLDSYGILWDGSTTYDWHGYVSMRHLGEALEFVKQAKRPDLKFALWGKA